MSFYFKALSILQNVDSRVFNIFATDEMNKDMNLNKTYTEVFLQSKKKYTFNQVKQTFGLMFHIRRYSTLNIVFAPINYILHQLMGLLFVATIVD